jgi:DNA-binding MarR family transcriptional regulator
MPVRTDAFDPTEQSALDGALARTAEFRTMLRQFLKRTASAAAEAGLTPQRYDLLLMVKAATLRDEDATVSGLCESLGLQQPAVTELVQRAEQAGLVARSQSPNDGRVFHLHLTPDGDRRLLAVFTALSDDRSALAASFERLSDSFDAARL